MDDIQKQTRRRIKQELCDELKNEGAEMIAPIKLAEIDSRLLSYVTQIIKDPDKHNLFELLALRRFISFCIRYEMRSNAVKSVITVIESLKFPTDGGNKALKLSPVQVYLLTAIYGFYLPDGRRVCRNALLFVPRKFGKTTIVSGIAIYEFLFGDADGQVYACANSYQQAKLCFDNIRASLKLLDRTGRRFRVNREAIYNLVRGRSSIARCLAANPSTLDGLNPSCYILDEFSQAKDSGLRNVMSTATGARKNPLELIITTASDVQDGPCAATLEAYENILLGNAQDDSVFALIFQPDVDDSEDNPTTWHKVQPHLGVTINDDYYEREWAKAQQTSENLLAFRTKLLNVFAVDDSKAWITGDEIRALYKPFSFDTIADERPPYCMVSFDLSVWDDFSCVCYEIYRPVSQTFHFHIDYYIPEATIDRHPRRELYRIWIEKGWLHALPGDVIDYEAITQHIFTRNGKVLIAGIGYDPYHSRTMVNMLQASGAASVLRPIKQTYGSFTSAVEALEQMIKLKKCSFTPNEITAWCFGNCCMDEDRLGNRKPIKRKHSDKIDGAITCLMSQDLFDTFKR